MSLVGPRPAIPYEVEMYKPWHLQRLEAQPGITGLQQVTSRSVADFDEQVRLDIEYINQQSLWLDIKIILKTPLVISLREGRGNWITKYIEKDLFMDTIKVGIIGYGYWGPNLARNFYELPSSQLVAIADLREDQLKRAKSRYPGVILVSDYQELFKMGLDAVVVSTPPKTHYKVAKDCLLNGLHVLIEKPITQNSRDAEELVQIADDRKLTLMVGHTFEYNSAVVAMKKYIESKELGDLYYIDTARLNLGLFQRDSNVLWDLAPHDISILLYLLDENPISVSAQGMPCVIPGVL